MIGMAAKPIIVGESQPECTPEAQGLQPLRTINHLHQPSRKISQAVAFIMISITFTEPNREYP